MDFASVDAYWAVRCRVIPRLLFVLLLWTQLVFNLRITVTKRPTYTPKKGGRGGECIECTQYHVQSQNGLERDRMNEATDKGHKHLIFGSGLDLLNQKTITNYEHWFIAGFISLCAVKG